MFNQRSFHLLWIGQVLANSGDLFYIVGLISIFYKLSGSAALMAFIPFVITISRFGGEVVAPLLVERYSLKKILVYSQLGKTMLLGILALDPWMKIDTNDLYFVFLIVALMAFLDGWAIPTRNSLLPQFVSPSRLVKANSLIVVVDQIIQLGGWPIGAILVALFGGAYLIDLTIALFLLSTLIMMGIQDSEEKRTPSSENKRDAVKEGWVIIWKTPSLKTVAVMDVMDSIANVVWIAAILYIYVEEVLHKSEAWWGYINSAFFVGLMIGGLLSLKAQSYLKRKFSQVICISALLVGVFTLCFGLSTNPLWSLLMSVFVGVATQLKMIGQQTVVQLTASKKQLPKVLSARDAILTGTFGVASLFFGYVAETYGVITVFVIAANLLFFSSIWAYIRRKYLSLQKLERD
ncbi:MFS transporter [Bacillus sp. FJAT-52991]|uniref:MFS transporter n=1 Tax=Bacillus kandeliae TaxID=3129297 RepID=A0ABZ2N422_9BACI